MKYTLLEEILRIKKIMILEEEKTPIKLSVSSDGLVNFFDIENFKVYRYKLVANAGNRTIDIKIVFQMMNN